MRLAVGVFLLELLIFLCAPCPMIPQAAHAAAQYDIASSDPYERAAAEMLQALAEIERGLGRARPGTDPKDDRALQDALSQFLLVHRQLRENADKHQIQPPNVARLRIACQQLEDNVVPKDVRELKQELEQKKDALIKEREVWKLVLEKIKFGRKAWLAAKFTALTLDTMQHAVTLAGSGSGMGASQIAGGVNYVGSIIMGEAISNSTKLDSDKAKALNNNKAKPAPHPSFQNKTFDKKKPYDFHSRDPLIQKFYTDNRKLIDGPMLSWVYKWYFTPDAAHLNMGTRCKTWKEYVDRLRDNEDDRIKLRRHYLEQLRKVMPKHIQRMQWKINRLDKIIKQMRESPKYLYAHNFLEKWRDICRLIFGLPTWTPTGTTTITQLPPPQPGKIEFASSSYTFTESQKEVKVKVLRKGGSHGALRVQAEVVPGSAKKWDDYGPAPNRLDWADGDGKPKEFSIFLRDDDVPESQEELTLKLIPGPGVQLGANKTAKLIIIDDDKAGKPEPPQPPKPLGCKMISITPRKAQAKPGDKVALADLFTVTALMSDNTARNVTHDPALSWTPGRKVAVPRKSKFNKRYKISAKFMDCVAVARLDVEYPSWSKAMSDEKDIGAKAQKAPLDVQKWYALCGKKDGSVAFANNYNAARQHIMKSGFPGPRNAKKWINDNCPSWKCDPERGNCSLKPRRTPGGSKGYYALCRKKDGQVVVGTGYNAAQHHIMGGPFRTRGEARQFVNGKCPRWLCSGSGICAKAPHSARAGKGYYVVCNLSQGRVEYRKRPKPGSTRTMAGPFAKHSGAVEWAKANCPSGRCNSLGKCSSAPASGGQWNVVCSRRNGQAYVTKDYNPARNHIWKQRLRSQSDALLWLRQNCPTGRCNRNGSCLSQAPAQQQPRPPALGGNFSLVCLRSTGQMGITQNYNAAQQYLVKGGFASHQQAEAYARQRCPSLRCNQRGACQGGSQQQPQPQLGGGGGDCSGELAGIWGATNWCRWIVQYQKQGNTYIGRYVRLATYMKKAGFREGQIYERLQKIGERDYKGFRMVFNKGGMSQEPYQLRVMGNYASDDPGNNVRMYYWARIPPNILSTARYQRHGAEETWDIPGYTDKKQWWTAPDCTKGASGGGGGGGLLGQ